MNFPKVVDEELTSFNMKQNLSSHDALDLQLLNENKPADNDQLRGNDNLAAENTSTQMWEHQRGVPLELAHQRGVPLEVEHQRGVPLELEHKIPVDFTNHPTFTQDLAVSEEIRNSGPNFGPDFQNKSDYLARGLSSLFPLNGPIFPSMFYPGLLFPFDTNPALHRNSYSNTIEKNIYSSSKFRELLNFPQNFHQNISSHFLKNHQKLPENNYSSETDEIFSNNIENSNLTQNTIQTKTSEENSDIKNFHKQKQEDLNSINFSNETGHKIEKDDAMYNIKWANHGFRMEGHIALCKGDIKTTDVILTSNDGGIFYAHKIILAANSSYFAKRLKEISYDQTPVIIIPGDTSVLGSIVDFCYSGSTTVPLNQLNTIIKLAEELEIKGMTSETNAQVSAKIRNKFYSKNINHGNQPKRRKIKLQKLNKNINLTDSKNNMTHSEQIEINCIDEKNLNYEKRSLDLYRAAVFANTTTVENACVRKISSPEQSTIQYRNYPQKVSNEKFFGQKIANNFFPAFASNGARILLWRFLLQLLHDERYNPMYIRWLDRSQGIFRIMNSDSVAQLWGSVRKNNNMTYEKMSRGMRTYYKRSIMFHLDGTKLIYRFNVEEPEIKEQMRMYEQANHPDNTYTAS